MLQKSPIFSYIPLVWILFYATSIYGQDTLLAACENSYYHYKYAFHVPKDTLLNNQTVFIDSFQVHAVLGMPSTIQLGCSVPNCTSLGGENDTLYFTGTPNTSGVTLLTWDYTIYYNAGGVSNYFRDTSNFAYWDITPPLTANVINMADANCGMADGAAALYAAGSYPPFTYSWDNGQGGTVAIQLEAGMYLVTVHNAVGCEIKRYVTVESKEGGPVANLLLTQPHCVGDSMGAIQVVPDISASLPVSALWNTGDTALNITNLNAGDYILALTDAEDCTAIYVVTIYQPVPLSIFIGTQGANAGQNNGAIFLQGFGGTPPYQFFLNQLPVGDTIQNIGIGYYSLQMVDSFGCVLDTICSVSYPLGVSSSARSLFQLYPNPVSSLCTLSGLSPQEELRYEIHTPQQQLCYKSPLFLPNSSSIPIDLRAFPAGAYIISVYASGREEHIRVWKE